jgi:hypothetical protein
VPQEEPQLGGHCHLRKPYPSSSQPASAASISARVGHNGRVNSQKLSLPHRSWNFQQLEPRPRDDIKGIDKSCISLLLRGCRIFARHYFPLWKVVTITTEFT